MDALPWHLLSKVRKKFVPIGSGRGAIGKGVCFTLCFCDHNHAMERLDNGHVGKTFLLNFGRSRSGRDLSEIHQNSLILLPWAAVEFMWSKPNLKP